MNFEYLEYEASRAVANVVVDGAANDSTVLTLSHWPAAPTPAPLQRDLSAEIAFAYLETPSPAVDTRVVTNNHFDQDGLVSVFALCQPDAARAHRELLIDVARAGDFGWYQDRRAARASMVIARWADEGIGYENALVRVLALANDPEPYRALWEVEDGHLSDCETALRVGAIAIEERPEIDLAIVRVEDDAPIGSAHRFAHETVEGVHPMALYGATGCFRLVIQRGQHFRYVDRYETWVQYQSRTTRARVDMRPLAATLTEADGVPWSAGSPDDLAPELATAAPSNLAFDDVLDAVVRHLGTA